MESLTTSRQNQSNEPSDALRVVNSLLTELDQIRTYNNIMILTTSNITSKIDIAFIDRADVKQYIGNPSMEARYKIICSCFNELMRVGIIIKCDLPNFSELRDDNIIRQLLIKTEGLSGRSLRKLPFLAHCYYLHYSNITIVDYINGMLKAMEKESINKSMLE